MERCFVIRATSADYEQLPEGAPYQLIDGELVLWPSRSPSHQRASGALLAALNDFVEGHALGELYPGPLDVYLSDTDAYQPDILFVSNERLEIITERNVQGAPDLIVEVLSIENSYYDLTHKKRTYESAGVKEYWIVDPMKQRIEVYENRDGRFELVSEAQRTGEVRSALLEGFVVNPDQVFT